MACLKINNFPVELRPGFEFLQLRLLIFGLPSASDGKLDHRYRLGAHESGHNAGERGEWRGLLPVNVTVAIENI